MKKKKNIKIYIAVGIVLGIILSATTSYIVADTLINSKDVYYQDNSSLGASNVQTAIDGTCTKFSNQLTNLKTEILNETYPIGSVYMSYSNTNPSKLFGGTWEEIESGRVLRSTSTTVSSNQKAGSENVTLAIENLPSHNHTINHTHTIYGIRGNGNSSYVIMGIQGDGNVVILDTSVTKVLWASGTNSTKRGTNRELTLGYDGTSSDASTTVSGNTGSGTAFSVLDPYITVYMWKRTK